jgi:SecD/SecF fusion protein
MQSKGKLGSILAGIIAIFMILVCAFYLSFTFVNSKYEDNATAYAQKASAGNDDQAYNEAYKHYMDSVGEEKVYLGYTLEDVRKWGVNLGLDLKGGMNVILQVDMPDMIRQLAATGNDSVLNKAIANTEALMANPATANDDYVGSFIKEYHKIAPAADMSVVFPTVKSGSSESQVREQLRAEVTDMVNTSATQTLRKRIDQFGVVSPNIQVLQGKDGQILLELPGVKDHERVRELLQRSANLEFYETLTAAEVMPAIQALASVQDSTVNTTALQTMLATTGGMINPNYVILGYVASNKEMREINELVESPVAERYLRNDLVLRWGVKPETSTGKDGKEVKIGYALYALKLTNGAPALDGEVVTDANADRNQQSLRSGEEVSMRMNAEGARAWGRITGANVGKAIAIVLDDQVYSAPNVNGAIEGGQSSITGNFTVEEAKDLANVLKAGKMKAKVNIISDMVIGPSLGQQAIEDGMTSFVVALVLLMIFMCAFYGIIPGMVANLCLIFNLFFTFGILASFQAVLTMSGICGIVLSLGMAVDANVLIFERAKEELRAGKNSRTAIADGYANAFSAIFDSNLTSIITGVILMFFGTGPIKGFATTLIIGIICSFFTAVYLSRLFFLWIAKTKTMENMTFSTALSRKMFVNANINFIGKRKLSFTVVGIVVVALAASLIGRGLSQGIDFSGGRNYVVKFDKPVNTVELQKALAPEFDGATVSVITLQSSNQVRISTNYKIKNDAKDTEKEITGKLYKALNPWLNGISETQFSTFDADHGIVSSQKVGPTVADDMRTEAYIAVSLAMLAMFLYILVRFRNIAFSFGALAAVAFTAFTIIGLYSALWGVLPFAMEVDQTFIAAILTVIGYQINDTVVVFDRVRENVGLYPKQDFFTTINKSINSTLGRTIMTSLSTLLVLVVIFILGGDSIRSFVFAMILGVIIGTCATIFVASPTAYLVDARAKRKANAVKA